MSSTRLLGSFSNLVQNLGFTADQADALLVAAGGDTYKALSALAAQTDGPKVAMLGSHATRTAMEPGVVRMQPGSSTDTELNLRRVLGEGQLSSKTAQRIREVLQQQGAARALLLPLVRAARGGEWLTIRNVREGSAEPSGPPMDRPTKIVLDDLAVWLDKGERIIAWSLAAPPTQVLEALAKSPKPFLPNLDRAELIGAAKAFNACVQNGLRLETCPNMKNFVALMQPMHISWAGGPAAATCLRSILRQLENWCDHGRVKDEVVDLDAWPESTGQSGASAPRDPPHASPVQKRKLEHLFPPTPLAPAPPPSFPPPPLGGRSLDLPAPSAVPSLAFSAQFQAAVSAAARAAADAAASATLAAFSAAPQLPAPQPSAPQLPAPQPSAPQLSTSAPSSTSSSSSGRYVGQVGSAQLRRQTAFGRGQQFSEVVPGTVRVFPNAKAAADALQLDPSRVCAMIAIPPRTYSSKGADGNVYRAWRAD